jgi:hypothetical protein
MTRTLSNKDYILLSAYLDNELNTAQKAVVEGRLQSDADFKAALQELAYTKRLLASIPKVRARRNFTLSPEKVKKTAKAQRFQPVWGAVSAFSTLVLIALFAIRLLPSSAALQTEAPAMAPVADNAFSAEKMASGVTPTPMIILWNPPRAYGMGGGGGGGAEGSGLTTGGMGGGPVSTPTPELPAMMAPAPQATLDPSTMILGLPDAASRGNEFTPEQPAKTSWFAAISPTTWLMAGAGFIALLSALLAIFTRRR